MKVQRFEDLQCWQEARKLRKMVSNIARKSIIRRDYVFSDQTKRAALSVMSNIAEGFETCTDKEFINFLNYARRSCGEIRNHLYAALDDDYVDKNEFDEIYHQTIVTGKLISGFISYLRRSSEKDR